MTGSKVLFFYWFTGYLGYEGEKTLPVQYNLTGSSDLQSEWFVDFKDLPLFSVHVLNDPKYYTRYQPFFPPTTVVYQRPEVCKDFWGFQLPGAIKISNVRKIILIYDLSWQTNKKNAYK